MGKMKIGFEQMFDYLADYLESVSWSRETLREVGNSLIAELGFNSDPANAKKNKQLCDQRKLVESMMNALLTLVNYHSVAECLDFSPILPFIGTYDEECTDTILYILSCTGDMKYMETIEREAARFPSLPLEEYRAELLGRAGSAKDNI